MYYTIDDIASLVGDLGGDPVHVVGAKLGAQIGLRLASQEPELVKTMSLASVLISPRDAVGEWVPGWVKLIEREGTGGWVKYSQRRSVAEVRGWQTRIRKSKLIVIPGDSYHLAASRPDTCARHVLRFLKNSLNAKTQRKSKENRKKG